MTDGGPPKGATQELGGPKRQWMMLNQVSLARSGKVDGCACTTLQAREARGGCTHQCARRVARHVRRIGRVHREDWEEKVCSISLLSRCGLAADLPAALKTGMGMQSEAAKSLGNFLAGTRSSLRSLATLPISALVPLRLLAFILSRCISSNASLRHLFALPQRPARCQSIHPAVI